MARKGISFDQVANAAAALKSRGQEPTIHAIRVECGDEGSYSTISSHLAKWRAEQADKIDVRELPGEVEAKGMEAIVTLWNVANKVAQEGMAAMKQEHADDRKGLLKRIEEATEEIGGLEAKLDKAEDESAQLKGYIVNLEKKVASTAGELEATKELYKKLLESLKPPAVPGKKAADTKSERQPSKAASPESTPGGSH